MPRYKQALKKGGKKGWDVIQKGFRQTKAADFDKHVSSPERKSYKVTKRPGEIFKIAGKGHEALSGVLKGEKPMYRITNKSKAFRPVPEKSISDYSPRQPGGVYFGLHKHDLDSLIAPIGSAPGGRREMKYALQGRAEQGGKGDPAKLVKGYIQKNARVLDASTRSKWNEILNEFDDLYPKSSSRYNSPSEAEDRSKKLTDWLREDYDVVIWPDEEAVGVLQAAAINPGAVKVQLGKKVKLISAGTAAAAAALSQSQDAEAMPRGVFKKAGKMTGNLIRSSAARPYNARHKPGVLGWKMKNGKTIIDVLKGAGKFRKVVFDDGTESIIKQSDVNSLVRQIQTKQYTKRFKVNDPEGRTEQALTSLRYHEVRARPFARRDTQRYQHKNYLKEVREMGDAPPGTTFVTRGNKYFQMPVEYAEHLEGLGVVKIVRGRREKEVLK